MINTTINGFTILRSVGKGGMAEVFYAENKLRKRAAIKILHPELQSNEDVRKRFVREAETIAFLEHPNIRQVYDMGEVDGNSFIIMEYLDGKDLKQHMLKNDAIAEKQAVLWVSEALKGLGYAHEQGVVHRDIKPSNIFLTDDGKIKLLDFGIAKVKHEGLGLTHTNTRMGTPIYMSPEQIRTPKEVDHRTDIYSMGVTLWTLLNGAPPYDDNTDSEYELMNRIVQQPLPSLGRGSAKVNRTILFSTAKEASTRIGSCLKLLENLSDDSTASMQTHTTVQHLEERTIIDTSADHRPAKPIEKQGEKAVIEKKTASFRRRIGASLIDFLILISTIFIPLTIIPLLPFIVALFEWSSWRATPGKLLLGLRVESEKEKLGFLIALKRQFLKIITVINVFAWVEWYKAPKESRRLFHDEKCSTNVVRK